MMEMMVQSLDDSRHVFRFAISRSLIRKMVNNQINGNIEDMIKDKMNNSIYQTLFTLMDIEEFWEDEKIYIPLFYHKRKENTDESRN